MEPHNAQPSERETSETAAVDPGTELDRELHDTLEALVSVHQEIASIRTLLARRPSQEGSVVRAIDRLTHERGRLAERLGLLQLERRLNDGTVPLSVAATLSRVAGEEASPVMSTAPTSEEPALVDTNSARSAEDAIAAFRAKHMRPAEDVPSARRIRAVQAPPHTWQPVLRELLGEVGDLPALGDAVGPLDEIELLDRVTASTSRTRWASLPQPILREWIALIAARGRAILPLAQLTPTSRTHLNEILVRLPEYVAQVRPGHVHGLARHHAPETGTWHGDAQKRMDAMRGYLEMTGVEEESPASSPASIRRMQPVIEVREDRGRPGIDWAHWPLVRDKRVVLLGGEPREAHRERVESEMGMSSFEWVAADDARRVQAIADRIARHGVDMLLLLQPMDTKTSAPIVDVCRTHDVLWANVNGHTMLAISSGIEASMVRDPSPASRAR
ncbi:MAG: hypothetical protein ACHREM_20735 [Polyangiales bacterium]